MYDGANPYSALKTASKYFQVYTLKMKVGVMLSGLLLYLSKSWKQLTRISLYAVALHLPFIRAKKPKHVPA